MSHLPLVSIAAINYNNSKTVIETLESIRNQTYPNIELIVVDDCSTDNDVELINDWLKSYTGNYKFIQHEKNLGISATYNSGLKNATGKYFSTVDTDDAILPEKIEIQVKILEASDEKTAAVYSNAYLMDVNSALIEGLFIQCHRKFSEIPSGNIYKTLLQGNYIPVMSVLIKKAIFNDIGLYDEDLYDNDFDMWLRIAKKYDIVFSDYISSKYRIRPGSLSFVITQNEWMYTDAKIFLKHIGAPLPVQRLKNLALEAYCTNDMDTMPLVNELADKENNNYFKTAYLLWKYRVPVAHGEKVLAKLDNNDSVWYRRK